MNYYELKISINPQMEDIISDIFFTNFDCEGVVLAEEAYKDLEMTSTTRGTLKVFLTSYPANLHEVLHTERELLKSRGFSDEDLGSWKIELDEKENQDWSKKWKEKWTVTHVTDKIAVVPSWIEYQPKPDEITITLDPGCAFGTGTHQTTQLCMKAIEKYMHKGDSVADIGTGTGILAICAMKFGASSAYGCDIDDTVIDVCIENAEKNGMTVTPPPNPLPQGAGESDKSQILECNNAQHGYSKLTQSNANNLRNNATKQEIILWQYLRKSSLGYKFRRQQPFGKYIVDFFCPELKLVIELDGGQHNTNENKIYNENRDKFITNQGCKIIRIWNNDIDNNIEGVIEHIKNVIAQCQEYPPLEGGSKSVISGWGQLTFEINTADKISEKYDFVCANILHNVLSEIMGDLKNIMKPKSKMVLSGILDEKKQVVLDAIEREKLHIIETLHQDQWTAFVVEN